MDNYLKFQELRNKHQYFEYLGYQYEFNDNLDIEYHFKIDGLAEFKPTLQLPYLKKEKYCIETIDNLIFNIGLVEAISYYKLTCAKEFIVNHYLDDNQIAFFKKLYLNGLGEFLYINNIPVDEFSVDFIVNTKKIAIKNHFYQENADKYTNILVNVGGGKDSIVTLELLKEKVKVMPFVINQRVTTSNCIKTFGLCDELSANRNLDKNILNLNKQGYLNGHTPFSAMVSFVSVLQAFLYDIKYVALSNESSASEPTIIGSIINHQYSKSLEYENDFINYEKQYLKTGVLYFSFLRPICELKIAQLFTRYKKYYPIFKSCNVGSKQDIWCCKCPKCLFVYIIMSSFMSKADLVTIFNADLFENKDLKETFNQLIGITKEKPFECIGSIKEVNLALHLTIDKYEENNQKLPYLLAYYKELNISKPSIDLLNEFDNNHNLQGYFVNIIKEQLC